MQRLIPTKTILAVTLLGLLVACGEEDGKQDLHLSNDDNNDATSSLDLDATVEEETEGASARLDFDPEDIEKTMGLEEQTPLGFSASDLLKIIGGTHTARLVWSDGSETKLDFSFEYVGKQIIFSDRTPGRECEYGDDCRQLKFSGEGIIASSDGSFIDESIDISVSAVLNTGIEDPPISNTEGLYGELYFDIPTDLNGTFDIGNSELQLAEVKEVSTVLGMYFDANGFLSGFLSVGGVPVAEENAEYVIKEWVAMAEIFFD